MAPRRRRPPSSFPDPALADPDGLLGAGGDLSPARLLDAYSSGIFPWYSEGEPILWWSPDPRFVLAPARFRPGKSLMKSVRRGTYRVVADTAFEEVIDRCASVPRPGQQGTWITPEMRDAYVELHRLGFAHSIEAYHEEELAGGLYGISLGGTFCGESMFADKPDASKVALVRLVDQLLAWQFDMIDCQVQTDHLQRFGAREIPRAEFLERLFLSLDKPTRRGMWRLDPVDHSRNGT